jgi:adenosylcobinamide kinase/adenosylcobinamide-phosphate guanylyltransferase
MARPTADPVTFVATARPTDEEMRKRIERHRARRPDNWRTVEPDYDFLDQCRSLSKQSGTVLLDEMTLLVSDWLQKDRDEDEILSTVEQMESFLIEGEANWVIVSALVGQSPVPADENLRIFRDVLGRVNQALARMVPEVYEVKAGILNLLKGEGGTSVRSE